MARNCFRPAWVEALEKRQLLSVAAKIRLLGNESTIYAGNTVHVSAVPTKAGIGTSLGAGSPLTAEYSWDFGDRTAGSDYNRLPGFNAAHVYDTPGTYRLALHVTNELGESSTSVRMIDVLPSNRHAIYVNSRGDDHNDGLSALTAVRTMKRAQQLLTDNTDLLFRRGRTYQFPIAMTLNHSNVHVGAYGKGKIPRLQMPETGSNFPAVFIMDDQSHQILVENVVMESIANRMAGEAIRPQGTNITIRRCYFANLNSSIMNNRAPVGVLAYDNISGPTLSLFIFDQGSDHVYIGNRAGDSIGGHNIRIYATRVLCYRNDLTNVPKGSGLHTLRVNEGSYIYWANNTLHGGPMSVGPLSAGISVAQATRNVDTVVIENNRWMPLPGDDSSTLDRIHISAGTSGVMIRNNVFSADNALAIAIDTYQLQQIKGQNKNVKRFTRDVRVLNNTVTNVGTKGGLLEVNGTGADIVTLRNNLYVAPNLTPGPFTTSAVRVLGRRDMLNFTTLASGGGVDNNVWPKPGNADWVGVQWVAEPGIALNSYRTPAEWYHDFPDYIGSGEQFQNVPFAELSLLGDAPASTSAAASAAQPVPGVFSDMDGRRRPIGPWTAGAFQIEAPA